MGPAVDGPDAVRYSVALGGELRGKRSALTKSKAWKDGEKRKPHLELISVQKGLLFFLKTIEPGSYLI